MPVRGTCCSNTCLGDSRVQLFVFFKSKWVHGLLCCIFPQSVVRKTCWNQCNQWVKGKWGHWAPLSENKNKMLLCVFPYVKEKQFSMSFVTGSIYLSTGQRNVCSVNCPSRGGCRPHRCLRTPCGCSESLAPPPGSWAQWLGGCPASAAIWRSGLCWGKTALGIRKRRKCAVTLRWIQWFTWSLTLGGVTARTTL